MKKLLIILAFLPLFGWGQITTGYDFRYDGDIVVVGADTTLEGDTDYVLTNVDFDITLDYLPRKSKARLNDQPLCTFFQNANFADTLFALIAEHTLNADLTEDLPNRITEIWHYATPTVDVNDYAETPPKATVNFIDVTTTIAAAVSAASVGDTIYIPSGTYTQTASLNVYNDVTLQGLGSVIIDGNITILSYMNGKIKFNNIELKGGASTNRLIWARSKSGCELNNCYLSGFNTSAVWFLNYLKGDYYINNSVFYNTISTTLTFDEFNDSTFIESTSNLYECNNTSYLFGSGSIKNGEFASNYDYIKPLGISTVTNGAARNMYFNYGLYYKSIIPATPIFSADVVGSSVFLNIKGSVFNSDSAYGNAGIFNYTSIVSPGTTFLTIDNVTYNSPKGNLNRIIGTFVRGANINNLNGFNTNRSVIELQDCDTLVSITNNALVFKNPLADEGTGIISVISSGDGSDSIPLLISGNKILGGLYFGDDRGGHGGIYVGWYRNPIVEYNFVSGCEVYNIIMQQNTGFKDNLGRISYNTLEGNGLINRGYDSLNIFNNTIGGDTIINGIVLYNGQDGGITTGNVIRNNITPLYSITFDTDSASSVFDLNNDIDYLVIYGKGDTIARINGVSLTDFAVLKDSIGGDAHSFNTDPLLSATLCPDSNSPANDSGVDVGQDSLIVCGATYPNPEKIAVFAPFDMGAIEIPAPPKTINSAVRVIEGGQWIFFNGVKNTKVGY